MTEPERPFCMGDVTRLLQASGHDPNALMTLFYDEFRRLAASKMQHAEPGHTLDPTGLVHEALIRIFQHEPPQWQNSSHFFAAIALAMRNALVDHARSKYTKKRGGGQKRVSLDSVFDGHSMYDRFDSILHADEALSWLEQMDERKATIAQLHLFMGMTHAQTAEAIGCSQRTVLREWRKARAMMRSYLEGRDENETQADSDSTKEAS